MKTQIKKCGCEKNVFACRDHAHPTQAEAKHTPMPWHIEGLLDMELSEGLKIENKDTIVAEVCGGIPYEETLSNAAFIVRAVNSFDLMLEALKNIENDDEHMPVSAWELIQKAIQQAEGK